MKKFVRVPALICALILLLSLAVYADDPWSEEYYRIIDYTNTLTDEEMDSLDADCIEILREYHVDLAVLAVGAEDLGEDSLESWARDEYEYCSFGYGDNRDGFMAAYNADTEEVVILCFGNAETLPRKYAEQHKYAFCPDFLYWIPCFEADNRPRK